MAMPSTDQTEHLERLKENLTRIEELTRRLIAAFARQRPTRPDLQGPDPSLYLRAAMAYWAEMLRNPGKMVEHQMSYLARSLHHMTEAQAQLLRGQLTPPEDQTGDDPRFRHPLWRSHPWFNFLKQEYLLAAQAIEEGIAKLEALDPQEKKRLEFFAKQIIDLMAPTNFLPTNPEALARAIETEGESLVRGLENLVRDLEANDGELIVTLSDPEAFAVGKNLGLTEGAVVFRNRMLELIQYAPRTEQVHERPLLIFPPWINKFYILDLRPQNSLVRWIVEQGYTVFMVSWVNPDPSYADVGLDTYMEEGYLQAIAAVKRLCGIDQINVIGYCIGGTVLALTLALLAARKDQSINAATFFTTLTDFSDPGEVSVFLTDDFVDAIEAEVKARGIFESRFMKKTFSYLRANDLVYQPAVRRYLLGEAPPAFDLLYWNGDGTNLPARMTVEYLRLLCQKNLFATEGITLCGEKLHISQVTFPLCAIACETDHIAPWKSSFRGITKMGSKDKSFILSESGHIAGIVNPPGRKKYGHYTSTVPMGDPEAWRAAAERHPDSWWLRWEAWLAPQAGQMIPARPLPESTLGPAPGSYVLMKA